MIVIGSSSGLGIIGTLIIGLILLALVVVEFVVMGIIVFIVAMGVITLCYDIYEKCRKAYKRKTRHT